MVRKKALFPFTLTAIRHPVIDHIPIGLRDDLLATRAGVDIENNRIARAFFEIAWTHDGGIHRSWAFRANELDFRER